MDDTKCDMCSCKLENKDVIEGMGKLEAICEPCSDHLTYCNRCSLYGTDEDFSYGQEYCNDCCDYLADMAGDND